ncbi:hypothetical protein NP233_g8637 [Leucocoprinus birnbaumii]|uniref:L-tryptophan decarboxylase PsiD-like domain-containing protein n=1 Tax=Leucocoprinus birnbaumii TaxID=56174 RepID=A0AAD5VLZ9_9AGAR|nr:hypothetical protein NP233_g8637 [Leucocoprinus birnbaumii]
MTFLPSLTALLLRICGPSLEALSCQSISKSRKYETTPPKQDAESLHPVIIELQDIIESDPSLFMGFHQMFEDIPDDPRYRNDPTGKPQVRNYREMLRALQALLTCAPEFGDQGSGELVPAPFNAILNWPMNTSAGLHVFTHQQINDQIKKILNVWAQFLSTPESRYVLTDKHPRGWFSPSALVSMCAGNDGSFETTYICDPSKEHYGFASWDDFFTRRYRPGVRPIASPQDDNIITSACESVPYKLSHNVQHTDSFWLKGETYSLSHMLSSDPLTPQFIGGTVYQAYLSATTYHRWHSPVSGRIVKIVDVPGTYCAYPHQQDSTPVPMTRRRRITLKHSCPTLLPG